MPATEGVVRGEAAVPPEGFVALLNGRDLSGWKGLVGNPKSRAAMSDDELADYIARTEPYDKAGAYALQSDDGWLVAGVAGSRSNVMGLPLSEIIEALAGFGVERSTPHRS